ncbi:hypothetical protein AB0M46_38560 [Dactylosporangium sp. NPDC051485]|uniref:hypothetical protein n=1 Tax=Dactylosporangium sp. NPDC051485 TaxID=3154846 RepID=UPI00344955CE
MRRSASIALAVAAGAAAIVPAAAPASAAVPDFGLVSPVLASMLPGQTGWVSTMWASIADVCDVKITASANGVTVKYPSNTSAYSSLSKGDTLAAGRMDYAAFNLTLPQNTLLGVVPLTLNYSYTTRNAGATTCTGVQRSGSTPATIATISLTGDTVVQKTSATTVPKATPVWSQLNFHSQGTATNVQVTVSGGPSGLVVSYPGDRAYTSLSQGSTLPAGADDYAAVKFDATNVPTGVYKLTVKITYGGTVDTNNLLLTVS